MNLMDLRQEVWDHGFDANFFPATRVNRYLNNAYLLICTRVEYYTDEATLDFSTVSGTMLYSQPADMGVLRSVRDTVNQIELQEVGLRDLDRTNVTTGQPVIYAMDGANIHLFPTPNGVYSLEIRYWKLPAELVNDADTPTLPARWHWLLWKYAVAECYKLDDDLATGNGWMQDFLNGLAQFESDVKFPSQNEPAQVKGMWDAGGGLSQSYWPWN